MRASNTYDRPVTNWYDNTTLPRFDRPPVVETAMAIEFAPISGLDFFKLTRLQSAWEDTYPNISDKPGAPPTPPAFDADNVMQFTIGEPPRRIWAESPVSGLLVQSQSDRLILNWRRDFTELRYPGYSASLRNEYERVWGLLLVFLEKQGLSAPSPVLAEFTYVNAVPLTSDDELQNVVTVVRSPEHELPGTDRFGRFQFVRSVVQSQEHPFNASINVQGEPQDLPDGSRQLVFTVVSRVLLAASSGEPLAGMDAAHALAAQTFARIVTDQKQQEWGRTN